VKGTSAPQTIYGDLVLDFEKGLIIKAGVPVACRYKIFEILTFLARNPNRVIPKDELIQAIWGGAAISDDALTQALSQARKCIGDENREIIRTIPKRGYLFTNSSPSAVATTEKDGDQVQEAAITRPIRVRAVMGWTAPRTASACQDGRCHQPI
jgi:DNA-binding winged helix-turn-helix (wHTH) protein